MQIGLGSRREVEVDDDVDGLNVDPPGAEVRQAGEAHLGNGLRKQLNPLYFVAEYDALIDI
eukprot:1109753-Amorphochlora_amoeboformis.AAC.1